MRIVFYSHVFLPLIGGIQTSSVQYVLGLLDLGHDVTLVTSTPAPPEFDKQFPFRVIRLPQDNPDWRPILEDADVIVSNGFSLKHLRPWRKSKVPFGWIHAMQLGDTKFPASFTDLRWYLRYHARRLATRLGHFNICVSNYVKTHIRRADAEVIYNPINPMFKPAEKPLPPTNVSYFGRMWHLKGIFTLVKAIKVCRQRGVEIPVDFYGDGQDKENTIRLAQEVGVADLTHFFPFVQGDDLLQAIQAAKFIVVPSIIAETFGLAAAEPMACGKCVIGSKGGGLGEILEGVSPTFTGGDEEELASCMIRVAGDLGLLRECEKRGLERSVAFARETISRQYDTFLAKVVARYGRKKTAASLARNSA